MIRNKIYILLISIFYLFGCKNNYKEYYENGNIRSEILFIEDTLIKLEYNEKGVLKIKKPFIEGKITGLVTEYYDNGKKISEYYMLDSVLNGSYIEYYNSGYLKTLTNFKNGDINGKFIRYYNNKNKLKDEELYFINGIQQGKGIIYYSNGNYKEVADIKDGMINGIWVNFYDNGTVESIIDYKNDTIYGRIEYFDSIGGVRRQMFMHKEDLAYYADFDSLGNIVRKGGKKPKWLHFWSENPAKLKCDTFSIESRW